ncbi:hypothetical protein DV736_g2724, partial [Chaetothyriales sp. CBS 134916]
MSGKYLGKLQDKRVLVVGGTSGIGYGVAEGTIEFGARVIVASRTQANVDKAVNQLKSTYPERAANICGHTVVLGAADAEDQLQTLFDFATNGGKDKLDHIIDTAGDLESMMNLNIETITPELIAKAHRVRFVGTALLAKFANKYLHKSHTSSFTMTTGVLTHKPSPGLGVAIAVAGGGKEQLTKGLAIDIAPIRVNAISPGVIETPLMAKAAQVRSGARESWQSASLLKRIGRVEDTSEFYLAVMRSEFVTGTVIHVEGGYLLN